MCLDLNVKLISGFLDCLLEKITNWKMSVLGSNYHHYLA